MVVVCKQLIEVVIARDSDLVNRTPKEALFRSVFNAAIVAVHRRGEPLQVKTNKKLNDFLFFLDQFVVFFFFSNTLILKITKKYENKKQKTKKKQKKQKNKTGTYRRRASASK